MCKDGEGGTCVKMVRGEHVHIGRGRGRGRGEEVAMYADSLLIMLAPCISHACGERTFQALLQL